MFPKRQSPAESVIDIQQADEICTLIQVAKERGHPLSKELALYFDGIVATPVITINSPDNNFQLTEAMQEDIVRLKACLMPTANFSNDEIGIAERLFPRKEHRKQLLALRELIGASTSSPLEITLKK